MPEGKCRLEVILNCYDETGELVSDIPKGSWFDLSREEMNACARGLTIAVTAETERWEQVRAEQQGKGQPPKR